MTERVVHVEHLGCKCRKCRCIRFTGAIEGLLRAEPTESNSLWPLTDDAPKTTVTEHALVFESQVRELHEQLVLR